MLMRVEKVPLKVWAVRSSESFIWKHACIIRFHWLLHQLMGSSSSHPPERLLIQVAEPEKMIHQTLIKSTCGINDSLKRNDATYDFGCWSKRAHLRSWYSHRRTCSEVSVLSLSSLLFLPADALRKALCFPPRRDSLVLFCRNSLR